MRCRSGTLKNGMLLRVQAPFRAQTDMEFWDKSLRLCNCLCDHGKPSMRRRAQQTGFSKSSVHRLQPKPRQNSLYEIGETSRPYGIGSSHYRGIFCVWGWETMSPNLVAWLLNEATVYR
jgi:hypothetical protein